MLPIPRCETNADVLELVKRTGRPYDTIARTIYGLEIVSVRTGGNREPPVVITAGSHAGEPAGVLAALALIEQLETDHTVYIVPLRDPFAWAGFGRCLGMVLGRDVAVTDHTEAESLLIETGTLVYREDENSLVVALVGDLVFASMRPLEDTSGPRDIERRLNALMRKRPDLIQILGGKRACWPSNLTGVEGCGDFERAFSATITWHGLVTDLNRQFTFAYPALEVSCVRDLVDRIRPGLVLDLHESQGSKFFLFVGTATGPVARLRNEIASAVVGAVARKGDELYSLKELAARTPPSVAQRLTEPEPGLIAGAVFDVRQGATFNDYCQRYGVALGIETGRWKTLTKRVDQQISGAIAGIRAFENQHRA